MLRDEKWAVVNRENQVRVLLYNEQAARRVAESMARNMGGGQAYRVIRVKVEQVTE